MEISDFMPTIQPMAESISQSLRAGCFFVLTSSIILKTARTGGANISSLVRPIITAAMITGLIAILPFWFNLIRDEFWSIAISIREEFASSVAPTGTELMQIIKPPKEGIHWLDIADSLAKAVQYALGWLMVWIGGIIQLPMMLIQYVMECLCYMFLPVALSLFVIDSTRGLAMRYLQQTLAILAWPIGFAVVDLVGYSLLTSVVSGVSAGALGVGLTTGFTPATMMIGGIVAIWLIVGSLATPIIMQMLFCSGTPMSSAIGQSIQTGISTASFLKFAAAAFTPAASISAAASAIPSVSSIPMPTQTAQGPIQQAALQPSSGSSVNSNTPGTSSGKGKENPYREDPGGEEMAAQVMAMQQIPQAVSY